MFSRKYYFNPDTLMIEEVKRTPRQKIIRTSFFTVLVLVLALSMRVGFEQVAESVKEQRYIRYNELLREKFSDIDLDLRQKEAQLAQFRNRDDKLYRAIFGLDPLSSSVREAGTGGTFRYQSLLSISNPEDIIDAFNRVDKISSKAYVQSSSFGDLYDEAVSNQKLLACKPSIQPISPEDPFWLTSSFGYRRDPFTRLITGHHGIDLAGPYGLNVYATGDGVVTTAEVNRSGYGREVVVSHGFGYSTRYAHLQKILVKEGEKVKRGQIVGTLGSSGRSTGPHLHYEVRMNNAPLNPMYYYYEELNPEEFKQITSRVAE